MEAFCKVCGAGFEAKRATAKYCGPNCRQHARRAPSARPATPDEVADASGLYDATRVELEAAGVVATVLGQLTLQLAKRVSTAGPAESGFSTLVKEFRATRAEALKKAQSSVDPVDEVKRKREAKTRQAASAR